MSGRLASGRFAWVALAVALLGATPGQAGTLVLDFDLSGSSMSFGGPLVANGFAGNVVSGSARVVLTDVDAQGMAGAMAQASISGLSLSFDLSTPAISGAVATLMGPVRISQMGLATGAFDGVMFTPDGFDASLSANVSCVGSQCSIVTQLGGPSFPFVREGVPFPNPMGPPLSIALSDLGTGMARLSAFALTELPGPFIAVQFSIRGRQVPEPEELSLLLLAALALYGVATQRRLRAP